MTSNPLPTPFQCTYRLTFQGYSNPLPTPVRTYPHTPIEVRTLWGGRASKKKEK
jgi:hypothetical protein